MKKHLLFFALIIINGYANSQTISVTLSTPAIPFQDADLGAMAFADIDNDGDKDLLITGNSPNNPVKTTLYLNDGSGNFTEATGTTFINVNNSAVAFAHVNNDNFIDLYITGSSDVGRSSNLYINNGNGTFSITTSPFPVSSDGSFAFEDIDNDNDNDIIITGTEGISGVGVGFTKLYTNNGSGIFSEVLSTPFDQLSSSSVVFIDAENDGDKDIILAGNDINNNKLTKLYLNNGIGVFTVSSLTTFTGISGGDLAVADSDNDGDMDVIVNGSSSQGRITKLYTNNGNGVFTEVATTPFIGSEVGAVEFADFDNDSDKDVIVLGAITGSPFAVCKIYQNQGNNTFVESNDLIGTYLGCIAIADIDNDSDLDFIIGGTHLTAPIRNPKLYLNNLNSPLGVLEFNNEIVVSFFPNPATDFINFNTSNSIEIITVFNVLGEIVLTIEINTQNFKIDVSALTPGSYFAKLEGNRKSKTIKLLKH
jgi:hypothetical protein